MLDARADHPGATLADLYDPDLMPPNLRRAHQALDRAVDRLYRRGGFASERERVEHLFMLYEKMQTPLELAARGKSKRRRENFGLPARCSMKSADREVKAELHMAKRKENEDELVRRIGCGSKGTETSNGLAAIRLTLSWMAIARLR